LNLGGWDTATALSIALVNQALVDGQDGLVSDFSFSGQEFGTAYRGSGKFGAWQVLPGDPGDLLRLALPIVAGTVSAGDATPLDLTGLTAVVAVSLELLPRSETRSQDLVFAFHAAGMLDDAPKAGVVTPTALTGPADVLDALGELGTRIVLNGLAADLAGHADRLAFVFASLNAVPPGADGWLTPIGSAYCYARTADGNDAGHLVVLSVTTDRDSSLLPRNVDPTLVAGGDGLVFAMSEQLFLEHVVAPALPDVFGGDAAPADFAYDPNAGALVATTSFAMAPLKEGAI
jgi:hypothetical protein